ncbi:MAG TPA: hypothetical protein VK425_10620, partial [Acidimicrobiales bacterium]|nr:hypothetical protein [Acidimicrobiales bacterium]
MVAAARGPHDREVAGEVGADDAEGSLLAGAERCGARRRARDDVGSCHQQPVSGDEDARAGSHGTAGTVVLQPQGGHGREELCRHPGDRARIGVEQRFVDGVGDGPGGHHAVPCSAGPAWS